MKIIKYIPLVLAGLLSVSCMKDGEIYRQGIIPVKAVDTTAAGDTYCGALCVALSEGRDIVAAAGFATAASAIAVTRPGAQESIPTRDEVDKAMESADDRCTSPSFAQ